MAGTFDASRNQIIIIGVGMSNRGVTQVLCKKDRKSFVVKRPVTSS